TTSLGSQETFQAFMTLASPVCAAGASDGSRRADGEAPATRFLCLAPPRCHNLRKCLFPKDLHRSARSDPRRAVAARYERQKYRFSARLRLSVAVWRLRVDSRWLVR